MTIRCTQLAAICPLCVLIWKRKETLPLNGIRTTIYCPTQKNLYAIGIKQRNENKQINIKIGDQAIKTTDNIKLLGVNFDDNLIFSQHISELCKKASERVGVLARLRNLITTETKLLLYKTAIMPYLTYCHHTWHFCKASDTRKVERIQERALRIVRFITYIQKRIWTY